MAGDLNLNESSLCCAMMRAQSTAQRSGHSQAQPRVAAMESAGYVALTSSMAVTVTLLVGVAVGAFLWAKCSTWQQRPNYTKVGQFQKCERCISTERERLELKIALRDVTGQLERAERQLKILQESTDSNLNEPLFVTQKGKSWHTSKACAKARTRHPVNELQPCSFCSSKFSTG